MAQRLTRAEVPAEQRWNLEDLFPSREAWEAELHAIEQAIGTVAQYKGRLGEGAATFLACVTAYEELFARFIRMSTYARLHMAEDGSNPANQGEAAKAGALGAKLGAAVAFVETEPLLLPEGTLERYLAEEPGLADYRRYITKMIEEKAHKLSMETEIALASLGEVHSAPYTIYERIKSSDITFEPITGEDGTTYPVSFSTYEEKLEAMPEIEVRRKAWASFNKGLNAYKNTMAATFATEVKKNVVMARLRKFESATHMLLHPQEVSVETYNNVLDTIQTELAPIMRRYARLRKRVLGMDTMLYPDIEAPMDPTYSPKTTYAEGSKLILDALAVMGPEYTKIMRTGLTEGWVDWADNVGKSTGAFCSSPYGAHPYVLVTWADSLRNAFILAHELGHAGHFTLAQRHQRLVNTRPSMFFVEAPSTINELLLAQHLMKQNPEPRLRRWINMGLLATYHHNFVRHLLEGELQRRIYALAEKGTPVTATTLCETKGALLNDFWGGEVQIDDGAKLTWMRQPHYYMGLYPYTYSAGLTVATAMAEAIKEEGQPAVERWLQVLKAGGTMSPVELAKLAGVDMTTPAPIKKAIAFVGSLVEDLEKSF
ncbi:MAG: oligoendopeptidase [Symbiobacteriaceae bacterium]|jgi:oligoendopeptidase F|nr:oligoendopeptidase [Symbiobacteriaceae bacterium]